MSSGVSSEIFTVLVFMLPRLRRFWNCAHNATKRNPTQRALKSEEKTKTTRNQRAKVAML